MPWHRVGCRTSPLRRCEIGDLRTASPRTTRLAMVHFEQRDDISRTAPVVQEKPKSHRSLFSFAPGLALLARFELADLRVDLLASLVVSVVVIPSAFAYAELANSSPAAGLYAAIAGMVRLGERKSVHVF